MRKLFFSTARITKKQMANDGHSSQLSDKISLQATYNYGVSLFHLGQDWAYKLATDIFKKVIKALERGGAFHANELRDLAQGSLACSYAKMATRITPEERVKFSSLAIEHANKVLDSKTASRESKALAFSAIGLSHFSQNEYHKAIDNFKSALELDNNIIAILGVADTYRKINETELALDAYRMASKMMASGGYASYRLGNLYREIGERDAAIEAYRHASALSVARLALGKLYLEDGDLSSALEEFRNAAQINKKNSEALVNIAWTILEMGSIDDQSILECVESARRAVQIDTGNANEWHRRTIAVLSLIAAGKPEQALKEAKLALEQAPDRAQAKFCFALCEYRLGRKDASRKILLSILRSNEQGVWRTKAETLMKVIKEEK